MTNKQKDLIKSLDKKKNRDDSGLFVAEGWKLVFDLLASQYKCDRLYITNDFKGVIQNHNVEMISAKEMSQISNFKAPSTALGLFYIPENDFYIEDIKSGISIFLDEIQDPGNLGTIIRLADWFGIKNIICSENTADAFSPKTIQATMGAISRVNVCYAYLASLLNAAKSENIPIYGTFLEGENIYNTKLSPNGIILMGNEGKGISAELESFVDVKLNIPSFSSDTSESLNVAIATAIVCSEFKRR